MQHDEFQSFSRMLALTAEQYGKTLSPEMLRFYFDGCKHLALDEVRAALNRHIRNTDVGQFMPKVADIIRQIEGGGDDSAYRALNTLQKAFGSVGAWDSVAFEDPIIGQVVLDMGGWPEICQRPAEEWANFGSKEFMRRYRAYRERGGVPDAPKSLPGRFAITNNAMGFGSAEPPKLVGPRGVVGFLPGATRAIDQRQEKSDGADRKFEGSRGAGKHDDQQADGARRERRQPARQAVEGENIR